MINMSDYMIGQRVIYENTICTVISPKKHIHQFDDKIVWISNPERGYEHWASKDNVKPLPGGQL
jgi:hypothetical protein